MNLYESQTHSHGSHIELCFKDLSGGDNAGREHNINIVHCNTRVNYKCMMRLRNAYHGIRRACCRPIRLSEAQTWSRHRRNYTYILRGAKIMIPYQPVGSLA